MKKYSLFVVCFLASSAILHASIIYVKHDATGNNDGTSWDDAYTSLHTAITSATTDDDIWVAGGTYIPENEVGGTGDRFKTFQMKNGVAIYGGFAGDEDPLTFDLDDRDFEQNETILSGDLGDDIYAYHVFRLVDLSLDETAVLDGVTIQSGVANSVYPDNIGGGILMTASTLANGSSPTLRNCVFKNNHANDKGGALYISRYCHPVSSNCAFFNNTANDVGGAVYAVRNTAQFDSCTFTNNIANATGNTAGGGAVYITTSAATEGNIFTNCVFSHNSVNSSSSGARGGAIHGSINPGFITILHSSFDNNAAQYGGAVYLSSGNDSNRDASIVRIENSSFERNTAMYGGGLMSDRHNSRVASCIIRGNDASEQAGGYYGRNGKSELVNSLISGNKAAKHGGGAYFNNETPEVINTTISGNYSAERGGGISLIGGTKLALKNSIIWINASPEGNQVWLCNNCEATLSYCFYGDQANDIFITAGGVLTPSNSSTNNPRFLNPYPPTSENTPNLLGNYFICGCNSPAVDAGNNAYVPAYITTDVRGITRILDGTGDDTAIVDPGAYEFDPSGCNALAPFAGDGSPEDPYEISMLPQLYWIAVDHTRWNKHYVQVANIDACPTKNWYEGAGWLPIGSGYTHPFSAGQGFTGAYNGNGYTISDLFINRTSVKDAPVGLFGVVTHGAKIENVHLINVTITGDGYVGGLAGYIGLGDGVVVNHCYSTGAITGRFAVGGLVGAADANTPTSYVLINESYSEADVTGKNTVHDGNHQRIGGFIGQIQTHPDTSQASIISNCYARGSVSSMTFTWGHHTGGFVGRNYRSKIFNCYATGHVNIETSNGGFMGSNSASAGYEDVANFWDTETSENNSTAGNATGASTANMKMQSTFTDAGWDFTTIWAIDAETNDGYPYLKNNPPRPTDATWDGGGDDDFTLTEKNWVNDRYPAPSANSIMRFAGSVRTTPYVNHPENSSFGTILFTSTADAFTLTGNVLNIHALIQNDATHTQTIRNNLVLSGEVECNTVAGDIHISGNISGTEALTKTGNHTLLLTADDNTYSGDTTVSAGRLGGKGCSTSDTTVNSGATLFSGSSIGIFSTADLTLNDGSTIEWEYQDGTGASDITASDYIAVNGTLVIDNSVTIKIVKLGDLVNAERLLFTFTDTDNPPDPDNLIFNFDEADGVTGAEAFISGTNEVRVTLVPEPGALSLLLISMLILPRIRIH